MVIHRRMGCRAFVDMDELRALAAVGEDRRWPWTGTNDAGGERLVPVAASPALCEERDWARLGSKLMFDDSVIKKTGQYWKGLAAGTLVILGSATMFAGLFALTGDQSPRSFAVMLGGMALAVFGFAFACWSMRCPECGARWLWLAVRRQPTASWIEWLMKQARCPVCTHTR